MKNILIKFSKRQGLPYSLIPFNTGLEIHANTIREDEEITSSKLTRKLSVFVDDIIIYLRGFNIKMNKKNFKGGYKQN